MNIVIRKMREEDWKAVARIYQEGIDTGNATFTSKPPDSWEEWCKSKVNECSLMAVEEGSILGWAALSPVSSRCVYAGVGELSIYIAKDARGKGVGSLLMEAFIHATEENGFWMLQTGIFPENHASLQLHYKHGFREVGIREKLGLMEFGEYAGQWRDVVFLERRSKIVGI